MGNKVTEIRKKTAPRELEKIFSQRTLPRSLFHIGELQGYTESIFRDVHAQYLKFRELNILRTKKDKITPHELRQSLQLQGELIFWLNKVRNESTDKTQTAATFLYNYLTRKLPAVDLKDHGAFPYFLVLIKEAEKGEEVGNNISGR